MKYQIGNNFLIMETRFALFFYLKNMKISCHNRNYFSGEVE
jgi:hypothetical protein